MRILPAISLTVVLACLTSPLSACDKSAPLENFVAARYGSRVEFDVIRNGKTVGRHATTFTREDDGLVVTSNMELDIKVLLIPVYRFSYQSESVWCGDRMTALDATVLDNGDTAHTQARLQGAELVVEHAGREYSGSPRLIPTDHWNPQVLERSEVLNTITGQVNHVTIGACTHGSDLVSAAAPGARCYEYRGDLSARVWYDENQRWVGLAFAGADGSEIVYVCRTCARQPL